MSTKSCNKDNPSRAQILPFEADPELQKDMGSFQALQTQSNALLTQSKNIQSLIHRNRQNRLVNQQQIARICQTSIQQAEEPSQIAEEHKLLVNLRLQIAELDAEHVSLHQEFIGLQSHIRKVVRGQRSKLVESINRTRALTASKEGGIALVSSRHTVNTTNKNITTQNDLETTPLKKSA